MIPIERVPHVESVLARDYERHCGFPEGVLSQGRITHLASSARRAVWTRHGGVVVCGDTDLARRMMEAVATHKGGDYARLLATLHETCSDARSYLDVLLYCAGPPVRCEQDAVEMLPVEAMWPEGNDLVEHVFAVRIGAVPACYRSSFPLVEGSVFARSGCASFAHNCPNPELGGYRFHALSAVTHPHYRNQGLGKAVVSALVGHILSEGGVALWNCDVLNLPSVRLARAVGFTEFIWKFTWGVSEEEMEVRRQVISNTG